MKRKISEQYTETLQLEEVYIIPKIAKSLDIPTKYLYSCRKRYEKRSCIQSGD